MQVQNARKAAKNLQKIDSDAIDSVIAVSGALPGFVQSLEFVAGSGSYNIILYTVEALSIGAAVSAGNDLQVCAHMCKHMHFVATDSCYHCN